MAQKSVRYDALVDYFVKTEELKHRHPNLLTRAKNLEKLIKAYYGRKNDAEAIVKMAKIYPYLSDFETAFNDLDIKSEDPCMVIFASVVQELEDFYRRNDENGFKEEAKRLLDIDKEKYFEDYRYAASFIEMYIFYQESPFIKDFLEYAGISIHTFNRFVDIVSVLDQDLYSLYLDVESEKRELRRAVALHKEENMRVGVQTGLTPKGNKFTPVSFYACMPFYDDVTAQELFEDFEGYRMSKDSEPIHIPNAKGIDRKMKNFLSAVDPYNAQDITEYMYGKNPYKQRLITDRTTVLKEKDFYEMRYGQDGTDRTLAPCEKDAIVEYMRRKEIVPVGRAYEELKNRVFDRTYILDVDKKLIRKPLKGKKLEKKLTFVGRKKQGE